MSDQKTYQIPDEYFFHLRHVRPRFKNDVEEVLLYVTTSISDIEKTDKKEFESILNQLIRKFKKNETKKQKTIDNWRTEISALFALIQEKEKGFLEPSAMAKRLTETQYLDQFFNYFLYSFQYPGGFSKPYRIKPLIQAGVKFKPCTFILNLLIEGEKLTGKPFSITAEELTQCAYYDLRVTRDGKSPEEVAKMIVEHRKEKVTYDYKYEQLKGNKDKYKSKGDTYRSAGDILDYMVLANLLHHKGTGYYYYLNKGNTQTIDYHLNNPQWFDGYDKLYAEAEVTNAELNPIEEKWFAYVNDFDNIEVFLPQLDTEEAESISELIQEYYSRIKGDKKVPTKIIGDYGESLILVHEYLRTQDKSNRQHLINKIPTPLGVGYDIQSIEIEKKKRYIEVKTTKSRKAIKNNVFKLTPNEWDTAETIGEHYFIYYLVVNENEKKIFVIQDPVKQHAEQKLKVDNNLVVKFSKSSGQWQKLLEIKK